MTPDVPPIDLHGITTAPLAGRPSKVSADEMASPWAAGGSLAAFLERLPNVLAAADLKAVVAALVAARRAGAPAILGMGGHVIKVGLGPVVVDLMERGVITGVALNGSGIVHETELAMVGRTSEDVGPALDSGRFGMSAETNAFLQQALRSAPEGTGLGRAVGAALLAAGFPYADRSILAAAARLGLPATVHVAIGTDILHMHPGFDPGRTGAMSHLDFRILAGAGRPARGRGLRQRGLGRHPAGGLSEGRGGRPQPGPPSGRLHHRQPRLQPPLPPHGQRAAAPDGARRPGHRAGRPPRDPAAAHRGRRHRSARRGRALSRAALDKSL